MARKEITSREDIKTAGFNMARQLGIGEVTARKLAAFAGISTQPIFRHYSTMEDCIADIFEASYLFFDKFYEDFQKNSNIPFVNLGMAYIAFAEKEPNLFRFIFMEKHEMNLYEILNGRTGAVKEEMIKCKESGATFPEQVFMKMWMLIHGAACMTITRDYDLSQIQTRLQLEDAYKAFVR